MDIRDPWPADPQVTVTRGGVEAPIDRWLTPNVARFIVGANLACRGGMFLVVTVAAWCLPRLDPEGRHALRDHPIWDRFCFFDSFYYGQIASDGYRPNESSAAFFPAFPYLARWLGHLVGSSWAAGLLITNIATFVGSFFVYGLARLYGGDSAARRAVLFALVFPSSLFLACFYAEGLYFLAVAGALFFYERDRLAAAGLMGFLATATRPTGILLFPALVYGLLHRNHWRVSSLRPGALWLLSIPAGIALVMYIFAVQAGDPLAFIHAQAGWARKSTFPLLTIAQAAQDVRATGFTPWSGESSQPIMASRALLRIFDLGAVIFLFASAALALRRLDSALTLFILLSLIMPLSSGLVLSIERFATGVVPIYVLGGLLATSETRQAIVLGASTALLVLHCILFAMGLAAG